MKNIHQNINILLFALLAWSNVGITQSEYIKFHFTDGTQQDFPLNEVRKMDFNATQIRLHQTDETIIAWNFDVIDHYRYAELETNIDKLSTLQNSVQFDVFPNPASGVLNVSYKLAINESTNVSIYSLNGKRMLEQRLSNTTEGVWQYDISEFPSGSYLIVMQGAKYSISKTIIKP
jgi:hypothetical protein